MSPAKAGQWEMGQDILTYKDYKPDVEAVSLDQNDYQLGAVA